MIWSVKSKIGFHISRWANQLVFLGGKFVLIQYMRSSMSLHIFQVLWLPTLVIHHLERLFTNCFMGRYRFLFASLWMRVVWEFVLFRIWLMLLSWKYGRDFGISNLFGLHSWSPSIAKLNILVWFNFAILFPQLLTFLLQSLCC